MILSNWSKTKESIFKSKTSRKVLLEFLNKLKLSNKFNKSNEDTCTAIDFKINVSEFICLLICISFFTLY